MLHQFLNGWMSRWPNWGALAAFLVLVFLTGGTARPDVASLILLRPLSAIVLGWMLFVLRGSDWNDLKVVPAFLFMFVLLTVSHLVPLPFAVWSSLPGRELLVEADAAATLGRVSRPLSMVPWTTWNTLFSLLVPVSIMALAVKAGRNAQTPTLICFLAIGLFSGAFGFLQAISPNNISLHFYRDTGLSSAVGVFSNRNHQGVLLACLFPMLAALASLGSHSAEQQKFRRLFSVAIGLLLIPMLLVTGSRAGLVAGIVGLASVLLIYRPPELRLPAKRRARRPLLPYLLGASTILVLVMSALALSRGEALVRFLDSGGDNEERLKIWATLPNAVDQYWPVGSGMGSFVEAYQVYEPFGRLTYLYVNHAHNEPIELAMTAGLPGLILGMAPVVIWIGAAWRTFLLRKIPFGRSETIFVRLGLTILFILGLASMVDYPLRTPALASLAVMAAIWTERGLRRLQSNDGSAEGLVCKGAVV